MKPLRPQLRGLIVKLALFYVLLSLPSLVVVESTILIYEFESFMHGIEHGSLLQASERGAAELAAAWPDDSPGATRALTTWAQSWVLKLQRPRGELLGKESFILDELAIDPIAAAVLAPDGRVLGQAPGGSDWQLELPRPQDREFQAAIADSEPHALPGTDTPYKVRRVLTAVRDANGSVRGLLFVELRLPLPWHRFLLDLSLEWPIVLGYLIVFGLASSLFLAAWVTRRLNRVASAASAWSRGDFSDRIDDRSRDELGHLSVLLDRMALELKGLMQSRAQLATLAERQRLARDLHDTVKQQAFALNLQLAALRRQLADHPALERVIQAERLSGQMQRELAQILEELRDADAALPLSERIRARAREWAQSSSIGVELDVDGVPDIAPRDRDNLLRIVDEALANVLRHSGATRVTVALRSSGDATTLQIVDNGRGFTSAATGMGIENMRERAALLPAGQFVLETAANAGVDVRVTFRTHGPAAAAADANQHPAPTKPDS